MRFSPSVQRGGFCFVVAGLLLSGSVLVMPAYGQSYGDVTVRKNPDGSIETFDSFASSPATSRRSSRSGYKRSSQKYGDGVVVRKNADGSIETFDSGDVSPRRSPGKQSFSRSVSKSSDGGTVRKKTEGSAGVHKFVHKYSKGVTVKKNPDGTIEVIGFTSGPAASKERSSSSGKAGSSAMLNSAPKSSPSAKAGTASKAKRRTARRPRSHGNFGDVRVIRNADGSIETYDAN